MKSIKLNLVAVCLFLLLNGIQAINIDNKREIKEKIFFNSKKTLIENRENFLNKTRELIKPMSAKIDQNEVCQNPGSYGFSKRENTYKYYKIFSSSLNWDDSKSNCESLGARLPIIKNSEDTEYVRGEKYF